jgi:N-acetylneuraminate synthase/sialic acid synthase
MGDGVKRRFPAETKPLYKMAKKLVAARDLPEGHVLTLADVAIKSPNDGLPPYELDRVLGRATRRPLQLDESLSFEDLVS